MKERLRLLNLIWHANWTTDGDWYLPYHSAVWIGLKASLCVLFGLWRDDIDYNDRFIIARYDFSTWIGYYGEQRGWSELCVKVKGFGIMEGSDGCP